MCRRSDQFFGSSYLLLILPLLWRWLLMGCVLPLALSAHSVLLLLSFGFVRSSPLRSKSPLLSFVPINLTPTLSPTQNELFFDVDTTNLSPPLSTWRGGGSGNYSTSLTLTFLPCQISPYFSVFHLHGTCEVLVLGCFRTYLILSPHLAL